MLFTVAVTDNAWFGFLDKLRPDEVNFWRPSGKEFTGFQPGTLFLFKLHSPLNYIVGGGFFVRSERLPLTLAWEVFHEKNGAPDLPSLRRLIDRHHDAQRSDPAIGCTILNQPFFIPSQQWLPQPSDWKREIVVNKLYDSERGVGREVFERIRPWIPRFEVVDAVASDAHALRETERLYGDEYLRRSRLGQGAFRVLVTDAYDRRCSITGERTLPVLQAAHIMPYGKGPNRVDNGLLLRSDLHILFDRGYLTVTPELKVEVSPRIKEEYENGRDYYQFNDRTLVSVPSSSSDRPNKEYLQWHNESIFLAR